MIGFANVYDELNIRVLIRIIAQNFLRFHVTIFKKILQKFRNDIACITNENSALTIW